MASVARNGRRGGRTLAGADDDGDGSVRTLLLADLRDLFDRGDGDRLASAEITDALGSMEHRPWVEWGRQRKPITPAALARLLRPFGVRPTLARDGDDRARGYDRDDLEEAWNRYLPAEGGVPNRDTRDIPAIKPRSGGSQSVTRPNVSHPGNGAGTRTVEPLSRPSHSGGGVPEKDRPASLDLWTGGPVEPEPNDLDEPDGRGMPL